MSLNFILDNGNSQNAAAWVDLRCRSLTTEVPVAGADADYIRGIEVSDVDVPTNFQCLTYSSIDDKLIWDHPQQANAVQIHNKEIETTPNDQDILRYNAGTQTWENVPLPPPVTDAESIQGVNVTTTTPLNGQILAYNSGVTELQYINPSIGTDAESIRGVNVTTTTPLNGQILAYNSGATELQYVTQSSGGIPFNPITVDLYWNELTGSDANDGLTNATPVQTWSKVLEIGATYNVQQITIHLWNQDYNNQLSPMDSSFKNFIYSRTYNSIWDLRPLGASIIKLITDQGGSGVTETILTKQSYQPINPGVPANNVSFDNITHNAYVGILPDFVYFPSIDRYAAVGTGSTSTSSNLYSYNTAPSAGNTVVFYDDNVAKPVGQFLMLAYGKRVILERMNFANVSNGFGLIGDNFDLRGCTDFQTVCSGYLTLEGCSSFILEYCNMVDASNCEFEEPTQNIVKLACVGCKIGSPIRYSDLYFNNCVGTFTALENCSGLIDEYAYSGNLIIEFCSKLNLSRQYPYSATFQSQDSIVFIEDMVGTVTFDISRGSKVNITNGAITLWGGSVGIEISDGSQVEMKQVTLNDTVSTTANLMINIFLNSLLQLHGCNFNTATARVSTLIRVNVNSKLFCDGNMTFTTPMTAANLIQLNRVSNMYVSVLTLNTTANSCLLLDQASRLEVNSITNSGGGLQLTVGTTLKNLAANAYKNTTYTSVVAADNMCLIVQN